MDNKGGGGGREYQGFPSSVFCLTVLKNIVEELFCAAFQKTSSREKVYGQEGGRKYQVFPSKKFGLIGPKNFVGEPFCAVFQKVSGRENVYGREGGSIKFFRRKFFVLQCQKFSLGNPLGCH